MKIKILKILSGHDGGGVFTCEKQFISYWRGINIKVDGLIVGEGQSASTYQLLVDNAMQAPDMNLQSSDADNFAHLNNILESKEYVKRNMHLIDSIKEYDAIIYRRKYFDYLGGTIAAQNKTNAYWHMPLSVRNIFEKVYFNYRLKKNGIIPIGNSKYSMESLGKICKHFVYPGYDAQRATGNTKYDLRKKLGIPADATVVGIAARLKERKAQHLVIESINDLLQYYPDLHLIIAGGPLESDYAKKCLHLASENISNIHFIGHFENVADFYSSINIYINSRLDAEPFGISIAEAMGASLPVIALQYGGPSEMIINGKNGWLIREATKSSYLETLKNALVHRDKWEEMGKYSCERSHEFRSEINAMKFLEIIKNDIKNI